MQELLNPTLINEAREEAERLMAEDPGLERHPALAAATQRLLDRLSIS